MARSSHRSSTSCGRDPQPRSGRRWQTSSRAARRHSRPTRHLRIRVQDPGVSWGRQDPRALGPRATEWMCADLPATPSPFIDIGDRRRHRRTASLMTPRRAGALREAASGIRTSTRWSCCSGSSSCLDEVGSGTAWGEQVNVASGDRAEHGSRPLCASGERRRPVAAPGVGGRLDRLRPPRPLDLLASSRFSRVPVAWLAARETGMFAVRAHARRRRRAVRPAVAVARAVHDHSPTTRAPACSSSTWLPPSAPSRSSPPARRARVTFRPPFRTPASILVVPRRPVAMCRQGPDSFLVSAAAAASSRDRSTQPSEAGADLDQARRAHLETGGITEGDLMTAVQAVAPLGRLPLPRSGHLVRRPRKA